MMEEYYQMTLTDWMEIKNSLRKDLQGVAQSFVRIGYKLRKIEEQKLYEQDGYKTLSDFAKAEYGLSQSTTSRFMKINMKYSIGGYGEALRPEFEALGSSKLSEMLTLPDADLSMITPETPREAIRELKQFERSKPEWDGVELVEALINENRGVIRDWYIGTRSADDLKEALNPSGTRTFRKGVWFLMMYEDSVKVKKFPQAPKSIGWVELADSIVEVYKSMEEEDDKRTDCRDAESVPGTGSEPGVGDSRHREHDATAEDGRSIAKDAGVCGKSEERTRSDVCSGGSGAEHERPGEPERDEPQTGGGRSETVLQCGDTTAEEDAGRADGADGRGTAEPGEYTVSDPDDGGREPETDHGDAEQGAGGNDQHAGDEELRGGNEVGCDSTAADDEHPAEDLHRHEDGDGKAGHVADQPGREDHTIAEPAERSGLHGFMPEPVEEYAPAHMETPELVKTAPQEDAEAPQEIIRAPFGKRSKYMASLTEEELAVYLCDEYRKRHFTVSDILNRDTEKLTEWLRTVVDEDGKEVEA